MKIQNLFLSSIMILASSFTGAKENYLVIEHESGAVLASAGAGEPVPVASLTKIAAGLVACEWMRSSGEGPGFEFEVPAEAIRGGANPLSLKAGDRLTLGVALTSAMLASDNTATHAMAAAIGRRIDPARDGVEVFVAEMNRLAADLGMVSTRFVNPHGLDEPGSSGVSTAEDLGRLVLHAYDLGELPTYAAAKSKELVYQRGGTEVRVTVSNTNELVDSRGIDGLKTGTTRLAGPCLITSATRDFGTGADRRVRRLHVILLDSADRFRSSVLLLDQGWKRLGEPEPALPEPGSNESLRKGRD